MVVLGGPTVKCAEAAGAVAALLSLCFETTLFYYFETIRHDRVRFGSRQKGSGALLGKPVTSSFLRGMVLWRSELRNEEKQTHHVAEDGLDARRGHSAPSVDFKLRRHTYSALRNIFKTSICQILMKSQLSLRNQYAIDRRTAHRCNRGGRGGVWCLMLASSIVSA